MKSRAPRVAAMLVAVSLGAMIPGLFAQHPDEWPMYVRDSGGTKYSPLKHINRTNVAKLSAYRIAHFTRTSQEDKR